MEDASNQLYSLTQAFDFSEANKDLFTQSMREMTHFHMTHSAIYQGICRQYDFAPEKIQNYNDIIQIPHIFVTAFKEH